MPSILKRNLEADYKLLLSWRYDKVEFLGLPSLKENRPLTLEEIYVPLSFTREPGGKDRFYLPKALEQSRRLVVLGDPGSGKSTLIKLITYSFGRSEPTPLSNRFGPLLPVPIILRDYPVRQWKTKEDMLRAFIDTLDEEIRPLITVEWLMEPLRQGRGFLLLDGLDEVGGAEDRRYLRDNIIAPLLGETDSYTIATSRVVGYDEVRLGRASLVDANVGAGTSVGWEIEIRPCYLAPFTADDIEQFITRWYAVREPEPERRREGIQSLQRALAQNGRINHLAANPSLLTIIALVHRVTAHLPSGRVKLYDKIVEAYLESIQTYRKLDHYPASLDQMKRWLARVAWEMQNLRYSLNLEAINRLSGGSADSTADLLVSRTRVLLWLTAAIEPDRETPEETASEFLDYLVRRSGLLLERGPDQFSFVHLTFQEYFAAFHLRGMIGRFGTLIDECSGRLGIVIWHETLCLLFEMLAEFPGLGDALIDALGQRADSADLRATAAELFSALILDDESGLSVPRRITTAAFVLSSVSARYNLDIIDNLRELPTKRFDEWVRPWLAAELEGTSPEVAGRDLFVVGASLQDHWPNQMEKWVRTRGDLNWSDSHIADAVLVAPKSLEVSEWAVRVAPLRVWTTNLQGWPSDFGPGVHIFAYTFRLVELPNASLADPPDTEPRHRLLNQIRGALCFTSFLWVRQAIFSHAAPSVLRIPDTAMAPLFTSTFPDLAGITRTRYLRNTPIIQAAARMSARYLIRGSRGADRSLAEALAHHQTNTWVKPIDFVAEAESVCFTPDASAEKLKSATDSLQLFAQSSDDWSSLLGVSGLLALGKGTPALYQHYNALLAKGIKTPGSFTFPPVLQAETQGPHFIEDLPAVLRLAFLYIDDCPSPLAEFFEPSSAGARFFLSAPREFYGLAAQVLDPEGKTALSKWRNPR